MARKSDLILFFDDPHKAPSSSGRKATHPTDSTAYCREFGTLYKLRREVQTCFRAKRSSAPWAGAMCLLTGIDLLSCFYAGSNTAGGVKIRFLKFVEDCMPSTCATNKDLVYSLRNCLLHNFTAKHYVNRFQLILDESENVFIPNGENIYLVNLNRLHLDFEQGVQTYKSKITSGSNDETNFTIMFQQIGSMLIYDRVPSTVSPTAAVNSGSYHVSESMLSAGALRIAATLTNRASS